MFITGLQRSPDLIKQDWVEQPDGTITTKAGCKIYIPARWAEQRLAFIGNETFALGYFAVVVGQAYAVVTACTMVSLAPSITRQTTIGDTSYYEFWFDPGTTVVRNVNCVMDDTMPYQMYREFIELGKVPGYMDYYDMCNLFESVPTLAGVTLGANEAVLSAIASSVMKDPENLSRSFAFRLGESGVEPAIVPFRDVQYGATNTTAKLMGSFSDLAVTAALVNPSERQERFEDLLR